MTNTPSNLNQALLGARDSFPLILAAVPFGIVYGAMAHTSGMSTAAAMGMSLFVFAGASQFIAVSLLASAAAIPVILLTVFVVNLRHLLYAASLMDYIEKYPQWLRAILGFCLTDETFAVVTNKLTHRPEISQLHWHYLGSALFMYINWQLCSYIGISLGQQIPDLTRWGLDIAMVVAFIGIVVPLLKNNAQWACASVAFGGSLLTYQWPHQSGLLVSSLSAIAVGVILERRTQRNTT